MGKKVYFEAELQWAKVREEDRDFGKNLPEGSDQRNKLEAEQGHYIVQCHITEDVKKQMIKDGVPNKGMTGMLFKEDSEGKPWYKAVRKHLNPKFTNKDTGEQGVVMGPPAIVKEVDGKLVAWNFEEDGLIGNGSKAVVKLDVWDGKIVTLEAIKITEPVVFTPELAEGAF